ncbi:MAG: hypothetical protein GX113_02445 [Actinobacteria bacterium]|jgi:hypothetical protein|nr:hypothetical protein [Actinomycetota bacterium]
MSTRWCLAAFGFVCGLAFDWVMNLWHVIGFIRPVTWEAGLMEEAEESRRRVHGWQSKRRRQGVMR